MIHSNRAIGVYSPYGMPQFPRDKGRFATAAIAQKRTYRADIGRKYAEIACFSSHPAPRSIFEPLAAMVELGLGRGLRQITNMAGASP